MAERSYWSIFSEGLTQSRRQRVFWVQMRSSKHGTWSFPSCYSQSDLYTSRDRTFIWVGCMGWGKRRHSLGILSLEFLKYHEVSKV